MQKGHGPKMHLVPCWPVLAQNHRHESPGFVHCVRENGVRQLRNHTFPSGTEDLSCTASFQMAKQQGGGVHPGDPDVSGLFWNPQQDTCEELVIGGHPAPKRGSSGSTGACQNSPRPKGSGPCRTWMTADHPITDQVGSTLRALRPI